jgi:hypothetical protein
MAAISITAANVIPSSQATYYTGTAGATITQGQPLYLDTVTNTYKLANALTNSPIAGVALVGSSNGQQTVICSRDPNFVFGGTSTTGNIVLVGNTAGTLQPYEDRTTGWYVTSLGVMISTTRMNFYITGSNAAI